MKRTPLVRKTPLKRRRRMKPISDTRVAITKAYYYMIASVRKGGKHVESWDRGNMGAIFKMVDKCSRDLQPHHPYGRSGEHLMVFIWVTRRFHEWIHGTGRKEAYRLGWLQPEFEARPHDPNHPEPWTT